MYAITLKPVYETRESGLILGGNETLELVRPIIKGLKTKSASTPYKNGCPGTFLVTIPKNFNQRC